MMFLSLIFYSQNNGVRIRNMTMKTNNTWKINTQELSWKTVVRSDRHEHNTISFSIQNLNLCHYLVNSNTSNNPQYRNNQTFFLQISFPCRKLISRERQTIRSWNNTKNSETASTGKLTLLGSNKYPLSKQYTRNRSAHRKRPEISETILSKKVSQIKLLWLRLE